MPGLASAFELQIMYNACNYEIFIFFIAGSFMDLQHLPVEVQWKEWRISVTDDTYIKVLLFARMPETGTS